MDIELSSAVLISLLTLTILEVILGIDNIIFISILSGKMPQERQRSTRNIGLLIGMGVRILLLMVINWVRNQEETLFNLFNNEISGKDLILIAGGLFLIIQSTREIHFKMKTDEGIHERTSAASYSGIMVQITLLNIVFSLDSVITAIGMAKELWVMITAVVISMVVMMLAAKPISDYVHKNPSIKILALAFLVLIGVSLLAEGLDQHINKGYIYFAMAFSFTIEMINLRIDKPKKLS